MINQKVLMSGVDYFSDEQAINPYMNKDTAIDIENARVEHNAIRLALESAGVEVITVDPPENCQDGVYTANWALTLGNKAIMSTLPNARKGEEPYAKTTLEGLGFQTYQAPDGLRFSGQGDALPCGNYLFAGSGYRTDRETHQFLADTLGYNVITLQTVPQLDDTGTPVINADSGWPDSFFYDIDLALSVIKPNLIAWCPEAFTPESQEKMRAITDIEKIEVSLEEAVEGFACNLVSTGEVVVMSATAPKLRTELESRGLKVITPEIKELLKGGGYIRCTTLTLSNQLAIS